ncbi:LuxR family transcriptional regulator [Gordonia desulfuricans]|uniref:LuxR family transcriptional regulator n=1 Tax=Gordonia desulfuricans TaxID=89051 RepID=A0A7K3LKM8_9ACTN|nr:MULTISPECIES: cupin domain-containing protein [Gordonia]EMP11171.1 LuxR family transcriptional regulator [Gordonia sp. NB41Y]NDK88812.1 LuxR family transcriptional regulator [Gordonia desulfuricans]WLP92479.1 cupin domain-containing protein [Gordonia sp. NB41Y]
MESSNLPTVVDELITTAHRGHNGRAAQTLHGGSQQRLRQTVIALTAGTELAEHEAPAEATLQVLRGHVTLTAGVRTWQGTDGDLVTIPDERHGLSAQQDSAVLLTVITG